MKKSRYYNRFWVTATVVLSVLFAALFFPLVNKTYDLVLSVLFTAGGIIFIWIVYFVRAVIFTSLFDRK